MAKFARVATAITARSFFGQSKINPAPINKRVCVDVGGNGDCGFRAIAAGIIDNVLRNPRKNQELLKRLLNDYYKYFPQQAQTMRLLTPEQRLRGLLKSPGTAELVRNLAYVLRQLAVDEMVKHPEDYRGAFVADAEGTSPAEMRKPRTYIDESAIVALTKVGVPVTVYLVEPHKELHARFRYGAAYESKTDTVEIQLQQGHYIPKVFAPKQFESVATVAVPELKPVAQPVNDPELDDVLARIQAEDKRLCNDYEAECARMKAMLKAHELDKEKLLAIYIKGMANSDYLRGRVNQVSLENGNQKFFAEAIDRAQAGVKIIALDKQNHDVQVTEELVHAIARAVSIGHLAKNDVYDMLETKEPSSSCSLA